MCCLVGSPRRPPLSENVGNQRDWYRDELDEALRILDPSQWTDYDARRRAAADLVARRPKLP
jgi:hypothetical protein